MIQRVTADDTRVTRLGSFFQPPVPAPALNVVPAEPTPDPQALLDHALQQAREAGFEQGMQEVQSRIREAERAAEQACQQRYTERQQAVEAQHQQLTQWLQQLPEQAARWEDHVLRTAAELAYAAVLRVLADVPPAERVQQMCQQALAAQPQRPVTVRCAPTEAAWMESLAGPGVSTEADPRLQPGQCRVESPLGVDDAGLDVRLDALRQAFLQGLAEAGARA